MVKLLPENLPDRFHVILTLSVASARTSSYSISSSSAYREILGLSDSSFRPVRVSLTLSLFLLFILLLVLALMLTLALALLLLLSQTRSFFVDCDREVSGVPYYISPKHYHKNP